MNRTHIVNGGRAGSITVEASLILPVYIFSIMALIYILQIILIQNNIHSAMIQSGEFLSRYAYVYDYIQNYGEEENSINKENIDYEKSIPHITKILFLQSRLEEYLNEDLINHSCIVGGTKGIIMAGSSILENNDRIELKTSYVIKVPFSFLGLSMIKKEQYLNIRGFTGYKPVLDHQETDIGELEDKIVYITRTGMVYHLNEACTHIRLDIKEIQAKDIEGERNENGGKYYPCESCMRGKNIKTIQTTYITSNGDRYHSSLACSKLKRSVIKIKYSQVKNRKLCNRCGAK